MAALIKITICDLKNGKGEDCLWNCKSRKKSFFLRGHKVMLDSDLAALYGVPTGVLNQAVKRNKDRFPDDFIFQLTREEIERISQIVISSGGYRTLKFSKNVTAFTEQGVAMLSSVLRSKRAVMVNVAIMRVFVKIRRLMGEHKDLVRRLDELEKKYDVQFKVVFDAIRQLMAVPETPKRRIGFRGDTEGNLTSQIARSRKSGI